MPTTKKQPAKRKVASKQPAKKTAAKKAPKKKPAPKKAPAKKPEKPRKLKYFEAIGRRKTATARVQLFTHGRKGIIVNAQPYTDYFVIPFLQKTVAEPMEKLKMQDKFGFTIKVKGGGITSQAEAIRHGISRALVKLNPYFRKRLKKLGFLTRDPRMRERKKPGLKRARRAPQWSKR